MINQKKQRIASILIGLGIAILLIIIGMKLIQRRGQAANNFQDFNCECIGHKCSVEIKGPEKPISIRYGDNYIADETGTPSQVSPGLYMHTFDFEIFSESDNKPLNISLILSDGGIHDDPDYFCSLSLRTEESESAQPNINNNPQVPLVQPIATEIPVLTQEPNPTIELPSSAEKSDQVIQFYQDNPEATIAECVAEVGWVLGCAQLLPSATFDE